MENNFTVPLNGWAQGRKEFHSHADKAFFAQFENPEILDADIDVVWEVEKTAREILVDGRLEGTLTVLCDRCLEELALPASSEFSLRLVFGPEEDAPEDDGRETLVLDPSEPEADLSQVVYDYSCLSLPVQRVHPDGGCNPDAVKHLGAERPENEGKETVSSPFAGLEELMKNKK